MKPLVIFNVEMVKEIEWNEELFDGLILPDGRKDLIQALVTEDTVRNSSTNQGQWDIVNAKGRGFVIHLYGCPGTGKTFTVEAMVERK